MIVGSFMKSLKEYIYEGLLDRVKNKEVNHEILIEEFLKENYDINGSYIVKETKNGFIVDIDGYVDVKNKKIISLTNEFFKFGVVSGGFYCIDCKSLKTLEGAPERVDGNFNCGWCDSLTSLEGAPKEVGCDFYCGHCKSLTSLECAPKEVGENFSCEYCKSLKTLEGAPKEVGRSFNCKGCDSLKTLKGAPKRVGGIFHCGHCGVKFTENDVRKYTRPEFISTST